MLLEFKVANYRSYREEQTFSFVASTQGDHPSNVHPPRGHDVRLLKSAVVYGANASGKSNLLKAMWRLGYLFRRGMPEQLERLATQPFALDGRSDAAPTRLTLNFLAGPEPQTRYEYSLCLLEGQISEEWLNVYPAGGRRQEWFRRTTGERSQVEVEFPSPSLKGPKRSITTKTRPDTPFLLVGYEFNNEQLETPARWILENLVNPLSPSAQSTARRCHEDEHFCRRVADFLRHADLGIRGVRVELDEFDPFPRGPSRGGGAELRYRPSFEHSAGTGRRPVALPFRDESEGTQRLFQLLGPWLDALGSGRLLLIDELATSMHPLLARRLIDLLHDPLSNPRHSQLLLTTHDVSLLGAGVFRRDQIWFTEKDEEGATRLYSLYDFHPRKDEALEKGYLAGRYRAIPFFGSFDWGPPDGEKEDGRAPERLEAEAREG